jgi:nicotinate-nucleotide pyrophosphorylase (carboxylating)
MVKDVNWTQELMQQALGILDLALLEDLGQRGDVSADGLFEGDEEGSGVIVAKAAGTLAGAAAVGEFFRRGGLEVQAEAVDGERVIPRQAVLRFRGPLREILTRERSALNLLGHLCGVATLSARFVDLLRGTGCALLDTRKTTPGWRALEKYAVRCGGGRNHRFGLFDMVLLKENHIAAAGDIEAAVERARGYVPDLPVEVEVRSLAELHRVLPLRVERVMLDNFTLAELRDAVALTQGRVALEASGGVDLTTVRAIAESGVDYVSVGALTHSAPALDLSLLLDLV